MTPNRPVQLDWNTSRETLEREAKKTTRRPFFLGKNHEIGIYGHSDRIEYGVAFSTKGDLIATGSYDKTVKVWKIPSEIDPSSP